MEGQVCRLVLETAIGPVLAFPEGKDSAARWEGWTATGVETQDPPCSRPVRQGPATAPMAQRSGAQRPARLAGATLAQAQSMEGPAANGMTW